VSTYHFERIYHENAAFVYNICLGMLGNPDDAKDAMQETFLKLHRYLPRLRGFCKPSTWLYRVAVNQCKDILTKQKKFELSDSLDWIETPDQKAEHSEKERLVREAMLKIKPDYRAVLVLFHFQQLSYQEIADSLGCSIDQVRIRLHRARTAFRKVYEDRGEDDEV
jgi:RNA polymerase sigma-70 factor (ECF subfamily)